MPAEKENHVYRGFRFMALQNKYRDGFNFTFDRLQAAINTLKSLDEFLKRLKRYTPKAASFRPEFRNNLQALMQNYIECLEDDISTPEALAVVFDMITWINTEIDKELLSKSELDSVVEFVKSIDQVL
jgi:cysteinyl-tRNA synthetase